MARHGKAVMAGYVPVRDGGFWRGGRGMLGSGKLRRGGLGVFRCGEA